MKKKFIILSRYAIKPCKVVLLSVSFFLLPVADVHADAYTGWTECVQYESQQVELIEHASSDFKIELMQNKVVVPNQVGNSVMLDLRVDSPFQEEFELIKSEFAALPVEEAKVAFMSSDPGFFFTLKLKNNVKMNLSKYIDPEDDDAYVNIWKDDVLVVQDYMPIPDLTQILHSYYDERS